MINNSDRTTCCTRDVSTLAKSQNEKDNKHEKIFKISKSTRKRETIKGLVELCYSTLNCQFCKRDNKAVKTLKNERNMNYHLNSFHSDKLNEFNSENNGNKIAIYKIICKWCGRYIMKQKQKRHEKTCIGHILKKYKKLNLKGAELINYVNRKAVYFNNKIQFSENTPKFDLIGFFKNFIKEKEKKECDDILNQNYFERKNRIKYFEKNDDIWLEHCYKIAKLFHDNKKEYFNYLEKEKEEFRAKLAPEIKEKKDYYNDLQNEIDDYIKTACKTLFNNDNFRTNENYSDIDYETHLIFSNKVLAFLKKNESKDFDRCPYCYRYNDEIYEHLFNYCEIYPIRIQNSNFLGEASKESFLDFIFKSIENLDENHKLIKMKFKLNKNLIENYVNAINEQDFNDVKKISQHLKNIYKLRNEKAKIIIEINEDNEDNDVENNEETISKTNNNNKKTKKQFFKELIEEINSFREEEDNNEENDEDQIKALKDDLAGETKVFTDNKKDDKKGKKKENKKDNKEEKNKTFNLSIYGLLNVNNIWINKANNESKTETFLGKKRSSPEEKEKSNDSKGTEKNEEKNEEKDEEKTEEKKELKIELKKWVDGMDFFEIKEKLDIYEYNIHIENLELFEIIDEFEIPFSFKYQIYVAFNKKLCEEKNENEIAKIKKNVKVFSKCIEKIHVEKIQKKKFLLKKQMEQENLENYLKIMLSSDKYEYTYKPDENYNNGAIKFIKDSKKYLKEHENKIFSRNDIEHDNALLAEREEARKSKIVEEVEKGNNSDNTIEIWKKYQNHENQELKYRDAIKEVDKLYGSDENGKKIYLQRNFLIINQIEVQIEEYKRRLNFKKFNEEAKRIAEEFEIKTKEEFEEFKKIKEELEKKKKEIEERQKKEMEEEMEKYFEKLKKEKEDNKKLLEKMRKVIGY